MTSNKTLASCGVQNE